MKDKVLVVEDSELGGRTLLNVLTAAGYDARLATTAAAAFAAADEWRPTAIVLDRHLPDADGARIAGRFRHADRRVVVLSGDPRPKGVRGVHQWLVKPVSAQMLLAAITGDAS